MQLVKELNNKQISKAINDFFVYCSKQKLIDYNNKVRYVNKSNFENLFGLAYVSDDNQCYITLDTNEMIRINNTDFYFSYLSVNSDYQTILVSMDSKENEKIDII